MRYELLFQPTSPEAPFPLVELRRALALPEGGDPEAPASWKFPAGEVEVAVFKDAGRLAGVEVRLPLSESSALLREALGAAAEVAGRLGVRLFDPQLCREVGKAEADAVAAQYASTARYAGQMLGVPEALAAGFPEAPTGMKLGTKVLLGIIGGALLLLWLVDRLVPVASP